MNHTILNDAGEQANELEEINRILQASEYEDLRSIRADAILGRGGSGVVFRVEKDDRYYALKVTKSGKNPNEREVNGKVYDSRSGYFIRMFQAYQDEEYHFILEPLRLPLDGEDTAQKYASDEGAVITLGKHICEALRILERDDRPVGGQAPVLEDHPEQWEPMLHLDIKPGNIFVDQMPAVGDVVFQLGDFGSARPVYGEVLSFSASEGFSAPEVLALDAKKAKASFQIDTARLYRTRNGAMPGFPVDIFSLGMTMYWCLCPDKSVVPERWKERCYSDGKPLPKPETCGEELWEVIDKATATDPAERYQNAEEMFVALEGILPRQKETAIQQKNTAIQQRNAMGGVAALTGLILAATEIYQAINKSRERAKVSSRRKYAWKEFGGTYNGAWADDLPCGKGTYTYSTKEHVESDEWAWIKDVELTMPDGATAIYTGMVDKDRLCGIGKLRREDMTYEGEWYNGVPYGYGHAFIPGKMTYRGCWKDGHPTGEGTLKYEDGRSITGKWAWVETTVKIEGHKGSYVGTVCNGKLNGEGTFQEPGVLTYEGSFQNGRFHGLGRFTRADGQVYQGVWRAGTLVESQ